MKEGRRAPLPRPLLRSVSGSGLAAGLGIAGTARVGDLGEHRDVDVADVGRHRDRDLDHVPAKCIRNVLCRFRHARTR